MVARHRSAFTVAGTTGSALLSSRPDLTAIVSDPPSGPYRRGPEGRGQGSTTRSSRWTTSWVMPSGRSNVRQTGDLAQAGGIEPAQPLGEHHAVGSGDLDRLVGLEAALDAGHAGRQQRHAALEQRPLRPVVDEHRARASRPRTRSTACGPAGVGCGARTIVPTPASPVTASTSTPSRSACAMTARTPDQAAILAAASFDAMPPLPRSLPTPPAMRLQGVVDLDDLLDERRLGVEAGVAGEQARLVGQQHQQVGADQVGDEGGHAVVVAEADLVVGDGVVLVDDGHDAELEQARQRRPGVEVLLAHHEVEGRQQHLAADQPALGERPRRTPASGGSARRPTPPAASPRRGAGPRTSRGPADPRRWRRSSPSRPGGRPGAGARPRRRTCRWPRRRSRPLSLGDRRRADLGDHDHPSASSSS